MTSVSLTLAFKDDNKQTETTNRRVTLDNQRQLDDFLASIERKAYRMALLGTDNRDDALELVQEAMLKLVEKYASRPQAEWTPLFYRILNSKLNDWYRKQRVRRRWMYWFRSDEQATSTYDKIENAPDERLNQVEQLQLDNAHQKLEQMLKKLSPRQRQAFLLRAWQGLNVAETAMAMNCTQGSVKTHYSRAIHQLRHWMANDFHLEDYQ